MMILTRVHSFIKPNMHITLNIHTVQNFTINESDSQWAKSVEEGVLIVKSNYQSLEWAMFWMAILTEIV